MIPGPFPSVQRVTQPIKGHDDRPGQQAPQRPELRADLPKQIAGKPGVIPYAQPKPDIKHKPRRELRRRDDGPSRHGLRPQGPLPRDMLIGNVQRDAQQRSQQQHGPVGASTIQQLQTAVEQPANGPPDGV